MNGIEKITARLAAEAEEEVKAILAEADSKCAVIKAGYDKKAEALRASLEEEKLREKKSNDERLESSLLMQEKKEILSQKQELLEEVFALAKKKILEQSGEDYTAFLAHEASEAACHGCGSIIMNPEDKKKFGSAVLKKANDLLREKGVGGELTLDEETRPIEGGIILRNGAVEVNCTVDTLLSLCRSEMASEVAAILFSETPA